MWTFRAMNTEVVVATPGLPDADERDLAVQVARRFAETEQRFSRFRADSELSALNRAEAPIVVSPELAELLRVARGHVADTGGLFEPAIGAALSAAGYDRSFAPGALDRATPRAWPRPARLADVAIDEPTRRVTRGAGVQLDFGGFLKGRTVDQASAMLPAPSVVDAGGDAMLRGGEGWIVDVEDPFDPAATLVSLRVRDRGVATSAANRRRWRVGDEDVHHLIDPRTGAASRSDLAQVTVIAESAERADVTAKVVFLLGAADGARYLEQHRELAAVLVTRERRVQLIGNLEVIDA